MHETLAWVEVWNFPSPAKAFDLPQLLANDIISFLEYPLAGLLEQISAFTGIKSPGADPPPEISWDTNVVLTKLGCEKKTICDLRYQDII